MVGGAKRPGGLPKRSHYWGSTRFVLVARPSPSTNSRAATASSSLPSGFLPPRRNRSESPTASSSLPSGFPRLGKLPYRWYSARQKRHRRSDERDYRRELQHTGERTRYSLHRKLYRVRFLTSRSWTVSRSGASGIRDHPSLASRFDGLTPRRLGEVILYGNDYNTGSVLADVGRTLARRWAITDDAEHTYMISSVIFGQLISMHWCHAYIFRAISGCPGPRPY